MCSACIEAKRKLKIINVNTKRTTMPFGLVYWEVCRPYCTLIFTSHRYYIVFINDHTPYTFVWVVLEKMTETCIAAYQSSYARVDLKGYKVKRFRCDNSNGQHDNETSRLVLTARGTTYEHCPPNVYYKAGVPEHVIPSIT